MQTAHRHLTPSVPAHRSLRPRLRPPLEYLALPNPPERLHGLVRRFPHAKIDHGKIWLETHYQHDPIHEALNDSTPEERQEPAEELLVMAEPLAFYTLHPKHMPFVATAAEVLAQLTAPHGTYSDLFRKFSKQICAFNISKLQWDKRHAQRPELKAVDREKYNIGYVRMLVDAKTGLIL